MSTAPFFDDFSDGFQPTNFNILQQKGCGGHACFCLCIRAHAVNCEARVCRRQHISDFCCRSSIPDNIDIAKDTVFGVTKNVAKLTAVSELISARRAAQVSCVWRRKSRAPARTGGKWQVVSAAIIQTANLYRSARFEVRRAR